MAGVYIHIPFCKTRCSYCDFYTQTNSAQKEAYIEALCKELVLRKNYLHKTTINTIYFGGGTPSQLSKADFDKIFDILSSFFVLNGDSEITLEANPDDLTDEYIKMLRSLPFNRMSVGIQSFDDTELKFLDRRHSSEKAKSAIKKSQDAGFNNLSIDLMYGLPAQTLSVWEKNLKEAIALNIQHISSYHLIYEEGTKMYRLVEQGNILPAGEDLSTDMFSLMNTYLKEHGFLHYEISNFAKDGFISRHNSSYWTGEEYLGVGASAHSYDGNSRCWNIASISKYIDQINNGTFQPEVELLTDATRYNDYVLTRMRTMWGADIHDIERLFGQRMLNYFEENIKKHLANGDVKRQEGKLIISEKGLFISDGIMSDLMYIDED